MVEAGGRAEIKSSLLAEAERLWGLWDTAETILDEQEKHYIAKKLVEQDEMPALMIKWHCEGLTAENWAPYVADPTIVFSAVNQKLTRIELPDDEGCPVRLLKMKMPMLVTDRSTLTTFYRHTKEDGTEIIFHSSQGNEVLNEVNASLINGDVLTTNVLTYMEWKHFDGGIDLKHIVKMDANGMIPDFIKQKAVERMSNTLQIMVAYLKDGTVPEPLF